MRLQKSAFSSKWGLTQNDNVGVIQYDYKYMNDFNYPHTPEPVVTVSRPLFSKYTIAYVVALAVTVGVAGAYWQWVMNEEDVPVVAEVVDIPLSEVETEIYRENVERITAVNDGQSEIIEITDENIKEVTKEEVAAIQNSSEQLNVFTPPPAAQLVPVDTFVSMEENSVNVVSDQGPDSVYTEGDVAVLDFSIEGQSKAGESVTLSGVVYSYDSGLQKLAMTSGGELYTVETASSRVTTKDGKLIEVSRLRKGDVVNVQGTKVNDTANIFAQTIIFTGVQDYEIVF